MPLSGGPASGSGISFNANDAGSTLGALGMGCCCASITPSCRIQLCFLDCRGRPFETGLTVTALVAGQTAGFSTVPPAGAGCGFLTVAINGATYAITASATGYTTYSQSLVLKCGSITIIQMQLAPGKVCRPCCGSDSVPPIPPTVTDANGTFVLSGCNVGYTMRLSPAVKVEFPVKVCMTLEEGDVGIFYSLTCNPTTGQYTLVRSWGTDFLWDGVTKGYRQGAFLNPISGCYQLGGYCLVGACVNYSHVDLPHGSVCGGNTFSGAMTPGWDFAFNCPFGLPDPLGGVVVTY